MAVNKYNDHVIILHEDAANRDIVNGFLKDPSLKLRKIQVMPCAGGWGRVVDQFRHDQARTLMTYPKRRIVLLIDFDDQFEHRFEDVATKVKKAIKEAIPEAVQQEIMEELNGRVFILGVLSNPEALRRSLQRSLEHIGEALAKECFDSTDLLWEHHLLGHNKSEIKRMKNDVKPFLFQ